MGTIECGFWKCNFIITPNEFVNFVNECEKKYKSTFICQTYGYPKHTAKEISDNYRRFYENYTAKTKPAGMSGLAHSMQIVTEKDDSSFSLIQQDIEFYINLKKSECKLFYICLSYPKGYAVICKDDNTKFEYADITEREPTVYPVFQKLANEIKANTKPFQFVSAVTNEIIKPTSVRISEGAAKDLAQSWLFNHYQLKMKSWN
jgi:hypothetical protein